MNTPPAPTAAKAPELQPIVLLLALALRMRCAFGECLESVSRIIHHARAQIGLQEKLRREILAIDDEMEKAAPLLADCLANDPPAKRKIIWAAWKTAHANTGTAAAKAATNCPAHLLQDK